MGLSHIAHSIQVAESHCFAAFEKGARDVEADVQKLKQTVKKVEIREEISGVGTKAVCVVR